MFWFAETKNSARENQVNTKIFAEIMKLPVKHE